MHSIPWGKDLTVWNTFSCILWSHVKYVPYEKKAPNQPPHPIKYSKDYFKPTSKYTPFYIIYVDQRKGKNKAMSSSKDVTGEKVSTKHRNELQATAFTKDNIGNVKHIGSFRDNTIASYVSQFYF